MKLTHLRIHNFRGILDAALNLFDYSLLVGPNNAGKSTVIDALRAFYEKDGFKFKHDRDFPFIATLDQESWIELTFKLTDAEYASLAEDYKHTANTLRVRKYWKTSDKNKDGCICGYTKDGKLSGDPFYGAKNVQSGKFGDIVFIPAVSKVDEHTKLTGPSALRDLLTNVLEAVVESSPSYEKFSKDFEQFAKGIKTEKTTDGRSLEGFESELSALLESWGTGFQLDMKSPSTAEIIKSLLSYQCVDKAHGKSLAADQFGSGFPAPFHLFADPTRREVYRQEAFEEGEGLYAIHAPHSFRGARGLSPPATAGNPRAEPYDACKQPRPTSDLLNAFRAFRQSQRGAHSCHSASQAGDWPRLDLPSRRYDME